MDYLAQFFGPIVPQCTGNEINAVTGERLCTLCDLLTLIDNIVKFLATVGPLVAIGFVMYGGFYILLSGGNPNFRTTGRKIITSALIGLAIVLASWIIVSTIFLIITGSSSGPLPLPWYRIQCQVR